MTTNGYIRCQLCGEELAYINWSHLYYKHGITCLDYIVMFPDTPMQSEDFVESRISCIRGSIQSYESNELRGETMKDYWETPEGIKRKEIVHLNFRGSN